MKLSLSQAEDFKYLQAKSDFLGSMMGRGVILLSLSMIKYSWYMVMKQNCERLDRIAKSTSKVCSWDITLPSWLASDQTYRMARMACRRERCMRTSST